MQPNGSQPPYDGEFVSNAERRARAEQAMWGMAGTLWCNRYIIAGITGVVAVLTVIISLLLPNWYRAESRLLLPTRSGSGLIAGALAELPSAAKSLLGGVSGDYARYLTILWSRSLAEAAIERFDLVTVYETEKSKTPVEDAMRALWDNVDFDVDEEYEHLTVAVMDTDPQRAADLTNFLVAELGRINAQLSSQSAAKFRAYIEDRYNETEAALDSVLTEQRRLQEHYGILDPAVQGETFFASMAGLRLEIFRIEAEYAQVIGQAQIEYEQLLSMYGPDNSLVRQTRQAIETAKAERDKALASARYQYDNALEGGERLIPVPQDSIPAIAQQFINLQKEQIILSELIKYSRPVLEEARFDEQREVEAVQVVDHATPPGRKYKPRRSIICIVATLTAFILAVLFVLLYDWWQRNYRLYAERLQTAAAQATPIHQSSKTERPREKVDG